MKPIILCADDYAINPDVGEGIRRLVAAGRLSAVSCMSDSPLWPEEAVALKPLQEQVLTGLHFNLTHSFNPINNADRPRLTLRHLIGKSLLGRTDQAWVEKELLLQLEQFEQAWGKRPDFVDGHQHVHVFPGIRKAVIRALLRRYPIEERPWIRSVTPPLRGHDALGKALVLRLLALGFAHTAGKAGLLLSETFAGLYSLSSNADFPGLMSGWLQAAPKGTLIMCHPAVKPDTGEIDDLAQARWHEWQFLISAEFTNLCKKWGIRLISREVF